MIGLREDQQMKVSLVNFLNHTAAQCGRGLAPPTLGLCEHQAGGWVCCIEGRWLISAYQSASLGLFVRHCRSG